MTIPLSGCGPDGPSGRMCPADPAVPEFSEGRFRRLLQLAEGLSAESRGILCLFAQHLRSAEGAFADPFSAE